jgi:hypothetical protein
LVTAGCPIDYPDAIARRSARDCKGFHAEQLECYAVTCVYMSSPEQFGYVVALSLATDRPAGTIITDWSIEPPWPNHAICWDYEPHEVIPKQHLGAYRDLLDSELMDVLSGQHLLRRGRPVKGLLCGYAHQPVPESEDRFVFAKLNLMDDVGNRLALALKLLVVRPPKRLSNLRPAARGAGLGDVLKSIGE